MPRKAPRVVFGTSRAPVAINSYVSGNSSNRITSRNGRTVVRHRELVSTIIGQGTTFAINNGTTDVFAINPTEPSTFKWLSTLATSYDTYNLISCCLEYVPLCSTATVGRAALFYDRDSSDVGPFDRNELSNFAYCVETSPWAPARLDLPDLRGERFMKDVPTTDDARLSDAGRIGWATYNTATDAIFGDLFICYEVELLNAQPASSSIQHVRGTVGALTSSTAFGPRLALSTVFVQAAASTITIRLNTGAYYVSFITEATGGGITAVGLSAVGDASFSGNAYVISNTNRAAASGVIVVRDTKATIICTVTGGTITNWQYAVARATAAISYF
jgi:hypothetical protein